MFNMKQKAQKKSQMIALHKPQYTGWMAFNFNGRVGVSSKLRYNVKILKLDSIKGCYLALDCIRGCILHGT